LIPVFQVRGRVHPDRDHRRRAGPGHVGHPGFVQFTQSSRPTLEKVRFTVRPDEFGNLTPEMLPKTIFVKTVYIFLYEKVAQNVFLPRGGN
jgi:hypothetical protein